tara:strand:+ start:87 stop:503 length:417 start_codon:yes stop_codon:yes gene_type:complete
MKITKKRLQEIIKEEYDALSPIFEEFEEELEEELDEDLIYEEDAWALGPSDYLYQEEDDDYYGPTGLDVGPVNEEDFLMGEGDLYEEYYDDYDEREFGPEAQCVDVIREIGKMLPDIPQNDHVAEYIDEMMLKYQKDY